MLPKLNKFFLIHRYICGKIFILLRKAANKQTDIYRHYITSSVEVLNSISKKSFNKVLS